MLIKLNTKTNKYDCELNGKKFSSGDTKYIEHMYKKLTGDKKSFDQLVGKAPEAVEAAPSVSDKFTINTRFSFVEKVVKMVGTGVQASAVITGEGGLGKSFTVLKTLKAMGMVDINDIVPGQVVNPKKVFTQIKGFSTAKNMFRTLYENNGSTIIFDDCDSILKDAIAINILKAALDSYDKRVITWGAEMRGDDDLPRSFEFTGKIVFISNLDQNKIDQAIRSRSMLIDLSMTTEQKLDRMGFLIKAEDFMPEYKLEEKEDALNLIRELQKSCKEISLRTLISVTKIRATVDDEWKELAEYTLCN